MRSHIDPPPGELPKTPIDADTADYHDSLESLNRNVSLKEKLRSTHAVVRRHFPFIARIAVATYDAKTSVLKTYVHSSDEVDPLPHYQAALTEAPSLARILEQGRPRVINNLVTFEEGAHEHTRRIGRHGYAASYTLPMFSNGVFFGFVFFNADRKDVFTDAVLPQLDVFGHMISLLVLNELATMRTLLAAVRTTTHITRERDVETGSHLDRMSRYARLIAATLADRYHLDDEYIEDIFMFSPLHDIGKIGIPDSILLKPDKLTSDESAVMRTHPRKGREIIDAIISNFGLGALHHVDVLRNIAEYHHEAVNGRGYPEGKRGDEIPLEARIVAVADVFDALTSRRPYKDPWSNDEAFAMLQQLAGETLDRDCVAALIEQRADVEAIQTRFEEDWYG